MATHSSRKADSSSTDRIEIRASLGVICGVSLVLLACGIDFGEAADDTELLKGISFQGEIVSGKPLTLVLEYAQQYAVKVVVKCDLLSVTDIPTVTPLPTETVSPLVIRRTPEPTLPKIPRVRPTPTNKIMEILGTTLQPNEDGGPVGEATPVLGTIERRFFAPRPGDYVVWCYTPVDRNNAIFEDLTIPQNQALPSAG